jgi:hypothetical protein
VGGPGVASPDVGGPEVAGPYQRGLVAGALIYFLGAATGLALGTMLIGVLAFDVAPLLAMPLVARRRRPFAALCWLALAATVPLAIGLWRQSGLMILPTAPLLVLAAFPGPRRWWWRHPDLPPPPGLARRTALVAAAGAAGLLLIEAVCGAF